DGRRWYNAPELPTVHGLSNAGLDLTHISNFSFYSAAQSAPHLPTMSYRVVMEPVGLNMFFLAPVPLRIRGEYPVLDLMSDGSIFIRRAREGGNDNDNPPMVGAYAAESETRNPEPYVRDSNSRDYPPRIAVLYLQLPGLDSRIAPLARQITAT